MILCESAIKWRRSLLKDAVAFALLPFLYITFQFLQSGLSLLLGGHIMHNGQLHNTTRAHPSRQQVSRNLQQVVVQIHQRSHWLLDIADSQRILPSLALLIVHIIIITTKTSPFLIACPLIRFSIIRNSKIEWSDRPHLQRKIWWRDVSARSHRDRNGLMRSRSNYYARKQ